MKKYIVVIILFTGLAGWQCSKLDKANLKESLQSSAEKINMAVDKISGTRGYELISVTGDEGKSGGCYTLIDKIELSMIAGIYDYQPDAFRHHHYFFPVSFFKRTGDDPHMIVNMPHRMIFRPKYLFNYCSCDPVVENNFKIDVSDYHLINTDWITSDYKLVAGFTDDSENIGGCEITSVSGKETGKSFSSKYTFTEGLSIAVNRVRGETTESSFSLNEGDKVLLMEKTIFTWTEDKTVEVQYILTIGNVDIKRSTGVDNIEVYLDGVLQQNAAVVITDQGDEENSICRKRDLEIKFDDGTTAKLSELIGPAKEKLKSVVGSLGEMNFAKRIVDYIAISVYFDTH